MQRVGDASDATAAVVEQQLRYDIGDMDWHVVDAGGAPEATLVAARTILDHTSSIAL
jgi:predicted kinase